MSWNFQVSLRYFSCELILFILSSDQLEEEEEFPFNMSDFVTVDEVGDVTDLPLSPSADPMEDGEGREDNPTSVPKDVLEVHVSFYISYSRVSLHCHLAG